MSWRNEYSRYKGFFLNIIDFYKKRNDLMMFLEIILTMTVTALFSVFALKPTAITIIELLKEIKAKEEVIAKMDIKLSDLKKGQANLVKEASRIRLLDTAIPTRADPEKFFRQVQGVTYAAAVQMNSASLDEVILLGTPKIKRSKDNEALPVGAYGIPFSFSFSANYDSLGILLSDLESLRRPLKIDSLSIAVSKKDELITDSLNLLITGQAPYTAEEPITK